jgi:hypothetical protein
MWQQQLWPNIRYQLMICWDRLKKTMNNFTQVSEVAETQTGHILDTSQKLPKPTGSVLKITAYKSAPQRCIHWLNMMLITTTISHWNFSTFYASFTELPQCKYPLYVLHLTQFVTFWETNYTIPHTCIITSFSSLYWTGNLYFVPVSSTSLSFHYHPHYLAQHYITYV